MMKKIRGKVQWFSPEKGFGFILTADTPAGKAEVFVNHSCIQSGGFRRLERGQDVELELAMDERGYFAKNVKVL